MRSHNFILAIIIFFNRRFFILVEVCCIPCKEKVLDYKSPKLALIEKCNKHNRDRADGGEQSTDQTQYTYSDTKYRTAFLLKFCNHLLIVQIKTECNIGLPVVDPIGPLCESPLQTTILLSFI